MSRIDELNRLLSTLSGASSDIEASAIVSEDGLIIASALPQGIEEARVAAMCAAILSIAERTVKELARGGLEKILISGQEGHIVVMHAGKHAVLVVLTRHQAKLGLLFYEMKNAADKIQDILP